MSKFQAGIFLIGMGLGVAFPALPAPLNILDTWVWVILIIIGIILIIRN
jgi:hypothetical protein